MQAGQLMLLWLTIVPLSGMTFGGRIAGLVTFVLMMVLFPLLVLGIHSDAFPVLFDGPQLSAPPTVITTLMLVCTCIYFIARSYEVDTERRLAQLDLQNQQLRAAQLETEQASRARTEFLATISHELRTPLNGLIGMTAALRGERDGARLDEGFGVLQNSADALLAVINDVLDFTKIEAGALVLERVPVNVASLTRTVADVLRVRATERTNTLTVRVAEDVPPWLVGDPTRLRQIVFNLVGNAIKFTERGHVECRVELRGADVVLSVSDDGVGMSPETVARICAPFVQADASTTRKHGGTGLGLAITRRLVDSMGGTLEIDSRLGAGSTFRVRVPCVRCSAPTPVLETSARPSSALEVLVVDDNKVNQLVARRLLERFGHHVALADDGRTALAAVEAHRFDVILMDCHMPVMDGYEATRLLRARGSTVPIIALTAAVSAADHAACQAAGMTRVLAKPLNVDELRDVLVDVGELLRAA